MMPYSSSSYNSGAFGKVESMPSYNGAAKEEEGGEDLWTCLPSSMVCGLDGNDSEESSTRDDSEQVCSKGVRKGREKRPPVIEQRHALISWSVVCSRGNTAV